MKEQNDDDGHWEYHMVCQICGYFPRKAQRNHYPRAGVVAGVAMDAGKGDVRMSLDKAIKHGKEHRKPYTGSKAFDYSCRNHGGCPWCAENRQHKFRDKHPAEKGDERSYMEVRSIYAGAAEGGERG